MAESVGQLFDWHREHPELIRLLLWEALEAGDEPDEPDENERERRDDYRRKARQFADHGVPSHVPEADRVRAAQDLLFTIIGMIAWNFAVPGLCRSVLDEQTDQAALARRREAVVEAARRLAAPATAR